MSRSSRSRFIGEAASTLDREGAAEPSQLDRAGEYTVDELAFAAGVPTRTIRFYQSKGVLPSPVRRGRVALYDERHVERLRLIGELKDRGLSLRALRHLLIQDSHDARLLQSCLGLDQPWSDDRPSTVSHDELSRIVSGHPPGTIAALVEHGVVARAGDGPGSAYRVPSPGLLRATLALQQSGVDIETAVGAGDILRRRLGAAARELVKHFTRRAGRGFGSSAAPRTIGSALDALRPLAGDAARLIFAQEIERALRSRTHRPRRSSRVARRRGRTR